MRTFSSGREAKEYLIAQIVLEAEREGMPLSETERKMMYFTETAWTLPDIWEVNEVFERDYDHLLVKLPISRLFEAVRQAVARSTLQLGHDHEVLPSYGISSAPTGNSPRQKASR